MRAQVYQHPAVELELLHPGAPLQVVLAEALGDLLLALCLPAHLQEQQVGELGDVLAVGDAVVAQDMAEPP